MPESQFGPAPATLEDTLAELEDLATLVRLSPSLIPTKLSRFEGLLQLLRYHYPPAPLPPNEWPIALTTHCAFDGCTHTWRDHDACLLNFAEPSTPPLWLCRDHHPPLDAGSIRPPGYQPPTQDRDKLNDLRTAVFAKLSASERSVINTRIVDMSGGGAE